jgi:hypothetical protein
VASIQLILSGVCSAQATVLALKPPAGAVTIDGQGGEWGDTLSYYNEENKIRYTISNDKDKLYLVVKVKDAVQESNILLGGLTFNIDTKGRKRSSFTTTFPSNGDGPQGLVSKAGDEPLNQKALRARYSKLKKIAVSGFREVNEDYITTTNTYGIQVAMDYTDDGYLVYEEAIPLALFHASDLTKGEWSFNIKLNGLESTRRLVTRSLGYSSDPVGSTAVIHGGGGGRSGGRKPTDDASANSGSQLTPTIDFWGKFSLAKVQ